MTRRIDTVVRVRQLQERIARADVAARRAALAAREREAERVDALLGSRVASAPRAIARDGLGATRTMLAGGVAAIARADREAIRSREAVELAMTGWMAAARRRDGVERLAERLAAAAQAAEDRRAARELDELVVLRWGRDVPGGRG